MSTGLYSHTSRAAGTILTASIYNTDHTNHVTNQTPLMTGAYSDDVTQMRSTASPGGIGTEVLAGSLAGELERLRFVLKQMKGTSQWYETGTGIQLQGFTLAGLPAAGTAGRLADVTDSIGGIHKDIGPRWIQTFGNIISVRERPFAAVGDDVVNDTVAIQAALNAVPAAGGIVYLPPGYTYLVNSANLTLKANTTLWIPTGAILHLDTKRLSAIDVSNITIFGGGQIKSTNLNTTDTNPVNWFGRGTVECGSTTATPISNIRIEGMEIFQDFVGASPGVTAQKRMGLVFINVKNLWVKRNLLHDIREEVIITNQGGSACASGCISDNTHFIEDNLIQHFGFDGITTQNTVIANAHIKNNTFINGYNGIEAVIGDIENNIIDTMANGGIITGGSNNAGNPVSYKDNIIRNVTGPGMDLSFNVSALSGPVQVIGNFIQTVGTFGINLANIQDLTATHNTVKNAGTAAGTWSSMAFATITRGYIAFNNLLSPGANAVRGMNYNNSTNLVFGPNNVDPHTDTHFNIENATGINPIPRIVIGAGLNESVTGTTVETTINTRTVRGNLLRSDGGFYIIAAGTVTGTLGTKTIRVKFGTSTLSTLTLAAAETGNWRIEIWLQNVANANSQKFSVLAYRGTVIDAQSTSVASEIITGNLELAVTGQLGNAGDTITQNVWVIDPFVGLRRTN